MATIEKETNAPTVYGKYVDKCLNEAAKHFFSEGKDKYSVADLFYAGVRCGKSWFEKQGEQKETLCDKCKKEQPSHFCQDITELGRCAVEHEQQKNTWTEYDQDMLAAIDCLTKQGRHLEKEHLDWIKSLKDRKGLKKL